MSKNVSLIAAGLAAAIAFSAAPAMAQSKGDWTVGVGVGQVAPKSDNGSLVNGTLPVRVGNDVQPTFTGEYFVANNLGIEVLAATPFKHDISIRGLGKVGSTKHLPPVLSLQYHFNTDSRFSPFVGVGVNYTKFFSTDTKGALEGTKLRLDDSWGVAVHAGYDIQLSEKGALRLDVRWADIDTKAKLDGTKIGTVNVDPFVYGVAYVFKF
ncbi:OmpW/AlkL family protein [Xanthomonas massiliensis]|jgi:outer membrane protein|uniref:OmpW/AlkL family protein n=1 Tax=Xanthomonas massiliensis TaxID=1720302 RepID=UPI000824F859|nr:OmpW family outer membrane protein [Xanthomonas massiliensis]